jgi:hypothetical protein
VGAVDRRLAFDRVVRRMTVSVACTLGVAAWFGCGARDARGTQVSIHAVPGGRVTLRLLGPVARGAHDFLLDGRRLSRTRRRAITVAVTPAAADPLARWRLLEVRRAGSRRVLARARFAMGASRPRAAPTLVLLAAPPPRTTDTLAVLRFSFSSRTASCSLDGSRLRPCSSPIAYNGLSSGTHRYTIRAADRHGTTTVRVASTILAPASAKPPTPPPSSAPCGTASSGPAQWDHVVWIVFENKTYSQIIGSANAPYINSIAKQCGSASSFFAEAHPSLPNYIAMTSGSTQGITDDSAPSAHALNVASIFSQLGTDWKSLQESMPSNCYLSNSGQYAVRHNPAAYYTNVRTQCQSQDVPLGTAPDLSAGFTVIIPNLCHDMHSSSCGSDATTEVTNGDSWLSGLLPKILGAPQYLAGRTAVFITWDEDDYSSTQHIATLVLAPTVPAGTTVSTTFNHYSMLRTTEEMMGLPTIASAAGASSMRTGFHL